MKDGDLVELSTHGKFTLCRCDEGIINFHYGIGIVISVDHTFDVVNVVWCGSKGHKAMHKNFVRKVEN